MRCSPEALGAALREVDARQQRRWREPAHDGTRNFCSNDYLGLAQDDRVRQAMAESALREGAGSGASHLVSGHGAQHDALERELAEFTGRERALVFSTGYMANLGVVTSLVDRDDLVLEDRLNHASLVDAVRLARPRTHRRYPHADAVAADRMLTHHRDSHPRGSALIVTDGVFSMDGDLAPLSELAVHARAHAAWLIVDDAHGLGVLGANGGGTCEHFGLDVRDVPVLIGTFGKALGTFGAFVAGDAALIEWLIQSARTYRYTTALPPAVAAATRCALRIVRSEPWRREALHERIAVFCEGARRRGLPLATSATPIQPVMIGEASRALAASRRLREAGFRVTAIRAPTVPEGSARLRVTLTSLHGLTEVEELLQALECAVHEPARIDSCEASAS